MATGLGMYDALHAATEVSLAILNGDLGPLGRSMGVQRSKNHEAPRLLAE